MKVLMKYVMAIIILLLIAFALLESGSPVANVDYVAVQYGCTDWNVIKKPAPKKFKGFFLL